MADVLAGEMAAKAPKLTLITNAFDPDLAEVKRFIMAKIAEGAFAVLLAAILALLARMRDLNTELAKRLEASRRKRPPSETLRRLQMELPFWGKKPDNDTEDADASKKPRKERKKRGPKTRHPHGRPKLPEHLPRVPEPQLVPEAQRTCPSCNVEAGHVTFKAGAEKLDIEPARYVVKQVMHEVVACPCLAHVELVRPVLALGDDELHAALGRGRRAVAAHAADVARRRRSRNRLGYHGSDRALTTPFAEGLP